MDSNSVIGIFLIATGLMILIPVLLQLREGRYVVGEIWGLFVLVGGFFVVGIAYAFTAGEVQQRLALLGLGAVLFGLLVQHKRRG